MPDEQIFYSDDENWYPDDIPSDWHSSGEYDEYDRYEDYVSDTGNDYLGMFDDDIAPSIKYRLKTRLRAIAWRIRHVWKWHTSAEYRKHYDDIPF